MGQPAGHQQARAPGRLTTGRPRRQNRPPTLPPGPQRNLGAGARVRTRIVMRKGNPKARAYVRQPGRIDTPLAARKLHGADKWPLRHRQTIMLATAPKHTLIEGRIMREQKIRLFYVRADLRPELGKGGSILYMLPGQSMDRREFEMRSRWPDQKGFGCHNRVFADCHQPQSAGARPAPVGGFKIQCQKAAHGTVRRNPYASPGFTGMRKTHRKLATRSRPSLWSRTAQTLFL